MVEKPERPEIIEHLDADVIEAAYRYQQLCYTMEDVVRQLKEQFSIDNDSTPIFSESNIQFIAQIFLNEYDCNVDDNTAWRNLLYSELEHYPLEELVGNNPSCVSPKLRDIVDIIKDIQGRFIYTPPRG